MNFAQSSNLFPEAFSWEQEWEVRWFAATSLERKCRVVHVPSEQFLDIVAYTEAEMLIFDGFYRLGSPHTIIKQIENRRIEEAKEKIWSRWMAL